LVVDSFKKEPQTEGIGDRAGSNASGSGTITTTYYSTGGHSIAEGVNGSISYLASDRLGSATVALDGSGNATASVLYGPYGSTRYSNGAMRGTRGFTNQHATTVWTSPVIPPHISPSIPTALLPPAFFHFPFSNV
jgi:hypothetical protein